MKKTEAINIIREVVREAIELDNTMTVLSVIDGKRNLDNKQIRQLFDDMPGTFYIHRHEEGEQSDKRKVSKQEAYKYVDYYNARLKGDSKKEEKLGAELKVLGFESELLFRIGEFNTDPSVFSVNEGPGKDYLDKVARDYFMEKDFDSAKTKPNANDVAAYIGETETDEISELELPDFLEEGNYDEVKVAEYQFQENKYDFGKMAGAGEYDSSIIIYKVVDKMGKQVLIPGEKGKKYPFLATSDRGPLGDSYPLLDEKHVKILKSIADIFEPREPDYDSDDYFRTQKGKGMNLENYADGKVKGKSRPGRVKKAGASCKGSVASLRAKAKKYGGEKGKMYHWCANMKGGKK